MRCCQSACHYLPSSHMVNPSNPPLLPDSRSIWRVHYPPIPYPWHKRSPWKHYPCPPPLKNHATLFSRCLADYLHVHSELPPRQSGTMEVGHQSPRGPRFWTRRGIPLFSKG